MGPGKQGQAEIKQTFLPDLSGSERGSDSMDCYFLAYVSIGGERECQMWNNELQPEIHAELALGKDRCRARELLSEQRRTVARSLSPLPL